MTIAGPALEFSQARALAARALFGFCQRTRHIAVNPAEEELILPG